VLPPSSGVDHRPERTWNVTPCINKHINKFLGEESRLCSFVLITVSLSIVPAFISKCSLHPKLFHYTPRRHLGEKVQLLLILDLGTRKRVSGQCHASAALCPRGKALAVPIGQKAGWTPEPVWTQRLYKNSFRLCRGSNLDFPVVPPVARHCTDLFSTWQRCSMLHDKYFLATEWF
jgi:hypothetical protein